MNEFVHFVVATRFFLATVPEIVSTIAIASASTGHAVNLLVQTATSTGLLGHCVAFYSLGLLWLLAHGTYQFWRILFVRPRGDDSP